MPSKESNPTVGEAGKLEQVSEERIEITCARVNAAKIVKAIKQAHSYEEPAIDIYPLLDPDSLH